MSTSTRAIWNTQKTVSLTGHSRHRHEQGPLAMAFQAPPPASHISFGPTALAAAIARTATLRNAPPELLSRLKNSALNDAEILIADGPMFALSPYLASLADAERTHFAARMGAGITDLYMNALGYVWRDNAVCLASTLDPHADFLYAGGSVSGHGVVLAEARGSFAAGITDAKVAALARSKYLRQVRLSLSQTVSCLAWIENRTMIVCNEGSWQTHGLDGCRSDPVAGSAGGRDMDHCGSK